MSTTDQIGPTDTAKLIRTTLRAQWPGVKFSVRRESQSTWRLEVRWTSGPTETEVSTTTNGFIGCRTAADGGMRTHTYQVTSIGYTRTIDLDTYKQLAATVIDQNTPRIAPQGTTAKIMAMTHIERIRDELRLHSSPTQAIIHNHRAIESRRNDLASAVDHVIDHTTLTNTE